MAEAETEERILQAAHEVFVRRGTAGARMQEIADEAGVNKALLHYYYRSKARLAEAVFQQEAQRLLPPVLEVLASALSIEEKVERVVALELDNLSRTPYLPGYILSELSHHPERAAQLISATMGLGSRVPAMLETLGRQLEERARAGTLRAVRPEEFVVNLLALCIFPFAAKPLLMAAMGLPTPGFDAFIERRRTELPRFFLNALRP